MRLNSRIQNTLLEVLAQEQSPLSNRMRRVFAAVSTLLGILVFAFGWQVLQSAKDPRNQFITLAALLLISIAAGMLTYRLLLERQRVAARALIDDVTGLPRRALVLDRLNQSISIAMRHNRRGAMLLLEVGGLPALQASFGKPAHDAAVARLGRRLLKCVRTSDTVGRLDDHMFGIVLAEVTGDAPLIDISGKVLHAVRKPLRLMKLGGFEDIRLTGSIGLVPFPHGLSSAQQLHDMAYEALARHKNARLAELTATRH